METNRGSSSACSPGCFWKALVATQTPLDTLRRVGHGSLASLTTLPRAGPSYLSQDGTPLRRRKTASSQRACGPLGPESFTVVEAVTDLCGHGASLVVPGFLHGR